MEGDPSHYTLSSIFYSYSRGFQRVVSIIWELIKNAKFQAHSGSQTLAYLRIHLESLSKQTTGPTCRSVILPVQGPLSWRASVTSVQRVLTLPCTRFVPSSARTQKGALSRCKFRMTFPSGAGAWNLVRLTHWR